MARAIGQLDPGHAATLPEDLHDFGPEHELPAVRFTRALHVVTSQRGVVDVPRLRDVDGAAYVFTRRLAEALVLGGDRGTVRLCVDPGEACPDVAWAQVLVGDMKLVKRAHHIREVLVALVLDDKAPRIDVSGKPHLVGHAQVAPPVQPVEVALPGHGATVRRGVVQPNDRAGVARRTGSGRGLLVHVQGPPATFGQLEAHGDTDHARPDDDRVVVLVHRLPVSGPGTRRNPVT